MRKISIALSSIALAALFIFIGASVSTVVYAATTACQVFNGCTGTTTQVTNGVTYYDGTQIKSGNGLTFTGTNAGIASTSPYAALSVVGSTGIVTEKIAATSTTATSTFAAAITVGAGQGTSTFAGGISSSRINITSGTSTMANGVNLTAGCFSRNGVCLGGGSGTVTSIATTYPVMGGPIMTTGTVALAFGTTTSNTWAGTQTFTNAPVLSSLATPAGAYLAVNPSGTVIATTTLGGGGSGSTVTPYFASTSSSNFSQIRVPVVAGDIIQFLVTNKLSSSCNGATYVSVDAVFKPDTFAASTTGQTWSNGQFSAGVTGCSATGFYVYGPATTTDTVNIAALTGANWEYVSVMATRYR